MIAENTTMNDAVSWVVDMISPNYGSELTYFAYHLIFLSGGVKSIDGTIITVDYLEKINFKAAVEKEFNRRNPIESMKCPLSEIVDVLRLIVSRIDAPDKPALIKQIQEISYKIHNM